MYVYFYDHVCRSKRRTDARDTYLTPEERRLKIVSERILYTVVHAHV